MTTKSIILFVLTLLVTKYVESVTVTEVKAGHLAELPCLSSDDHHRFMFWQLSDDKNIIGPGNPLDHQKYNYEVLTGKLLIRGVSTAESGFYKCVSRGIRDNSAINIHVVELVVQKEMNLESDFETNLLRGMTVAMVLFVIVAVVLLCITYKKQRNHRLFEMDESRESSPAKYNDKIQNTTAIPVSSTSSGTHGVDNSGLDVDFPKVFIQMQREQAIP
ncbi:uncharacterized protein LOC117172564 [Belonocnema kinseyi]|uniref:uncharacterized protein LOC117172564 n=1 Tax=Belonocnema kinseyi TaxID=2817044 RepID=UPI00143DB448|nr:uncharacterized protein LOC117172564 [Belonocnema kinseyi]XP_033216517.1 uncharacterized protein LOC117172564 [Belonocnema kinseyi]